MDASSSQSGDTLSSLPSADTASSVDTAELDASDAARWSVPGRLIEELWLAAGGEACFITQQELGIILVTIGTKCHHGLPAEVRPDSAQREAFYRSLRLTELALARACALGREAAWQRFLSLYRAPVLQSAVAITKSSTLGHDLADLLYSELFGLKERDGIRISPLTSYSGRGSLLGWLRTTLVQRHIDHHRHTHREAPLDGLDVPASPQPVSPISLEIDVLSRGVSRALEALNPDDRFLLSSYFLDRRTLLQIARLLNVHEATISRRLRHLIAAVREQLLKNLQTDGLSKRQAEEALGTDPRDIEINLRSLLQTSRSAAFTDQTTRPGTL